MMTIGLKEDTIRERNFTLKLSRIEEYFLKLEAKRTKKTKTELIREGYLLKIKEMASSQISWQKQYK